jgi:hypothetical protein
VIIRSAVEEIVPLEGSRELVIASGLPEMACLSPASTATRWIPRRSPLSVANPILAARCAITPGPLRVASTAAAPGLIEVSRVAARSESGATHNGR